MKKHINNTDRHYKKVLQLKISPVFEKLMPIAAIVSLVSSVAIFYSHIPKWYAIYDCIFGIIFIAMFVLKNKINFETKVFVTIILTIVLGITSFLDDGFNAGGITLLLFSNFLSTMLLTKFKSIIISIISVISFIVLFILAKTYLVNEFSYLKDVIWIIQFSVFLLFILFMNTITYTMRNYLVDNIEDLKAKSEEVQKIAFYDQYTNLPNLNLFLKLLKEKDQNSINCGYIVLFRIHNLDIMNSIYGEQIGNEVIFEVKNIISKTLKQTDILAKNSGKEFAVWLENISKENLDKWISNINVAFKTIKIASNNNINLEFYKSYSSFKVKTCSFDECYKNACLALVYAKLNKTDRIIAYNEEFEHSLYNEEFLKETLIKAIKEDEFHINYQPKVDILSRKTIGVEALARWHNDSLGNVSPGIFVPAIENMNKSVEFGELIIKKVLKDYEKIYEKYGDISIAINISPSHLLTKGFKKYLLSKANKYNIALNKLVIEITEEVLLQNEKNAEEVLSSIRESGIEISLDDFGTGYSSYSYLMNFDIDELKIDKSFIDQLCINKKSIILLKSIVYIAQSYDIRLIAEGVETEEQKEKLTQLEAYIIQGYLTGKPELLES